MTPKFDQLVKEMSVVPAIGKAGQRVHSGMEDVDIDRGDSNKWNNWDKLQLGLDVAGIEPTVGTIADGANVVISVVRGLNAAYEGERDQTKRHAINAAISAVSLIPFGDVAKLLKLRQ